MKYDICNNDVNFVTRKPLTKEYFEVFNFGGVGSHFEMVKTLPEPCRSRPGSTFKLVIKYRKIRISSCNLLMDKIHFLFEWTFFLLVSKGKSCPNNGILCAYILISLDPSSRS